MDNNICCNEKNRYRLGDCILYFDNKQILDQKFLYSFAYNDTIMQRMFIELLQNKKFNKIEFCLKIIKEKSKNIIKPKDNELVIHIRLGDVFGIPDNDPLANKRPNLEKIINKINKSKYEKIYIVTGEHYGKGNFSSEEVIKKGKIKSKDFIDNLISKIPERIKYEIKSSENIDDDFIFLCNAPNLFFTGNSSFSLSAQKIRKFLI